ncbi:glycosyltransferase [Exiguobacterium acetylicum]|uniref:glycosyltransferase n=1 Tax=Exiguobacterium acetylicum TaxID=41170 RepID=UPI003977A4EF
MSKLLSIIIPMYNVEAYIIECIESALKIADDRIELIIINDGSTDNTLETVNQYFKGIVSNKTIKIMDQKNQGVSITRNKGIIHASGEYILFLDSDDVINSYELEIFLRTISINKDLEDVIVFDAVTFSKSKELNSIHPYSNIQAISRYFNKTKGILAEEFLDYIIKKNTYTPVVWKNLYKREFIIKNNMSFFKGISTAEDDLFLFELLYFQPTFRLENKMLMFHRLREGSIMNIVTNEKIFKNLLNIFNYYVNKNNDSEHSDKLIRFFTGTLILRIKKLNSLYDHKLLLKKSEENEIKYGFIFYLKLYLFSLIKRKER